MASTPPSTDLGTLLLQVTQLVSRQTAVIGANSNFVAGQVSDPQSYDFQGHPGGGGYYQMTLVDGTIGYVPSLDALNHLISAAQAAGAAIQPLLGARDQAVAAATSATASQAAALASQNAAKTSETNSKTSETNAKTSETNAKTSETNSKTSETNSKTSETNSGNSAGAAAASATAAAGSVATAQQAASDAEQARDDTQVLLNQANAPLTFSTMDGSRWFFNHH